MPTAIAVSTGDGGFARGVHDTILSVQAKGSTGRLRCHLRMDRRPTYNFKGSVGLVHVNNDGCRAAHVNGNNIY